MTTKRELSQAIALLQAEYDDMQPVDGPRLDMWWEALADYPDGAVKAAAARHLKSSPFKPKLADIVALCESQCQTAWLTADEAWARMPKSEMDSCMLTDETAQAMAAADPLLQAGDRVAARMAFKGAYERLVEQAKIDGRRPKFFPSFGNDVAGRVAMLADAVRTGKYPVQAAIERLPEFATDIVKMAGVTSHPLLAAPDPKGQEKIKALLLTLKGTS